MAYEANVPGLDVAFLQFTNVLGASTLSDCPVSQLSSSKRSSVSLSKLVLVAEFCCHTAANPALAPTASLAMKLGVEEPNDVEDVERYNVVATARFVPLIPANCNELVEAGLLDEQITDDVAASFLPS